MKDSVMLTILGAALATYLTRFPLFMLDDKRPLPEWFSQLMSFIAPTVLTALIIPVIFIRNGHPLLSFSNEYVPAAIVSAIVAYFSKNMLFTVLAGIGVVTVLSFVK